MIASPQKEHGYTAIANEIMEALIRMDLSGQELRLILFVVRKTYGFHKKDDYISLSQMAKILGTSIVRCSQLVGRLQIRKILTVKENINGLTKKYRFNKNYEEWATLNKNINRIGKHKPTLNVLRKRPLMKTLSTKDTLTKERIKERGVKKPCLKNIKEFCQPENCNLYKNRVCKGASKLEG